MWNERMRAEEKNGKDATSTTSRLGGCMEVVGVPQGRQMDCDERELGKKARKKAGIFPRSFAVIRLPQIFGGLSLSSTS